MNVSFLENDPINSVIIDSNDGRPLYEAQTPWRMSGRTTTIRRVKPGIAAGQGPIIAEVTWRTVGSSTMTLFGTAMRVKDFLKKDGVFSSSKILTTSDGKSYKWSRHNNKFSLKDVSTDAEVAESHRSKSGWFGGTRRKMNIDISPQGMQFLDIVVVSFIIMKEKDRRSQETIATSVAVINANQIVAASS